MRFFVFLFCATCILYAEIIETSHFNDVEAYVQSDTLLILDIDDTLLIPKQALGTDAWFLHQYKLNQLAADQDPLDKALALWEAIRHLTQIEVVEEGSEKLVEELQAKGISIMGLTTQGLALATRTVKQLHSLRFDLEKTAPVHEDCYFVNGHGVLYRKGILFTSGTHKGKALLKFFELAHISPRKVVFVNDKQTHLEEVARSLEKEGIAFVGLRYSYSDHRKNLFRPEITDIQLRYSSFDHILSDSEAENILREELAEASNGS